MTKPSNISSEHLRIISEEAPYQASKINGISAVKLPSCTPQGGIDGSSNKYGKIIQGCIYTGGGEDGAFKNNGPLFLPDDVVKILKADYTLDTSIETPSTVKLETPAEKSPSAAPVSKPKTESVSLANITNSINVLLTGSFGSYRGVYLSIIQGEICEDGTIPVILVNAKGMPVYTPPLNSELKLMSKEYMDNVKYTGIYFEDSEKGYTLFQSTKKRV